MVLILYIILVGVFASGFYLATITKNNKMENKINIAELLKDCPKGMELYSILYDNIYFDTVEHNSIKCYIQNKGYRTSVTFDVYGGLIVSIPTKCVIFPKGKTTWEGFVPPCKFKDGDIVATDLGGVFILKSCLEDKIHYHCYIGVTYCNEIQEKQIPFAYKYVCHLATEEEKATLFDAIKANGYKWNPETKTLDKLPKFKVGDRIRLKNGGSIIEVTSVNNDSSICVNGMSWTIKIKQQDNYELVPNKFDITTLVPFESRVLVRNSDNGFWQPTFWGIYEAEKSNEHQYRNYLTTKGFFRHCIPYNDDTKHLIGTTNDCTDFYKTW